MADRILFVDDEQGVLEGYQRLLRNEFYVTVALGGIEGLAAVEKYGPFAVVISDMRMPGMNGAEFLAQVRHRVPDTVRMLLTGYTDLSAAIDAVNEGNIFRFLTKPCTKDVLVDAINIGVAQYRSITAEREMIKKAQTMEHPAFDRVAADICQWDNFEGPTGLPGPSQARGFLAPLLGVDSQSYVVLLTLTALLTLGQRYGEEAVEDYLNIAAQFLVQALRPDDRLFHWRRDVLMAVVRRQIAPAAMRAEVARLTAASRDHVIKVNGRSVMVAGPITFDVIPAAQFSTLDEMLTAFDTNPNRKV